MSGKSALVSENVANRETPPPGVTRRVYFIPKIGEEVVQDGISYLLRSAHPREPIILFPMQKPDSAFTESRLVTEANEFQAGLNSPMCF